MPIKKKIPTLEEVNALISNAEITGDYLPLSGGTLTGKLTIDDSTAFSQGDENVVYKVRVKTGSSQTGAISFGKEGSNSGSMVKFEQKEGTTRLLFRASNTPGAMVWQQPENGSTLYFDVDNIQYRLKDDGTSKGYKLDQNAFIPNKNNVGSLGDSTHNFQYLYASTIFENNTSLADKYSPKAHTHIQYLEKTDVSGTVIGSSKSLYKVTGQMYASNGIVFGGSAAQAGLVTRGVCGISTPDSDGNCEKENLYLNYDGSDTYSSSRQVVIQAGSVGTHYGNNLYQYAAARGDAVKNYADNHYAAKSHSHSISNISGLQTELNSKLDKQDIYSDGVSAGNDDVLTKSGVAMFIELELKGTVNGIASLDSSGKVPSSQLPSYVDDILDYSNRNSFPATGEDGKIYIAEDTNKQYRWSGTTYVEISSSLALGETASTAYAGNKGKANADAIAALQTGKANTNHTHSASQVSGLASVATSGSYNDLSNKPTIPAAVTVDSALSSTSTNPVQNKVINSALSGKADTGHKHMMNTISGLESALGQKANTNHTHTIANITNLQSSLDGKVNTSSLGENTFKVTRGYSVPTDTTGYWAAMCNSDNNGAILPTEHAWWHVLSMDWTGSDNTHWISQLALPTENGDSVYYRKNVSGQSIDNSSWIKLANSSDLGNYLQIQNPTFSGILKGSKWSNEPGTDEDCHSIVLGTSNVNYCNFYEYGGVWNFYKHVSDSDETLIAKIQADGIYSNNEKLATETWSDDKFAQIGHTHNTSDIQGLSTTYATRDWVTANYLSESNVQNAIDDYMDGQNWDSKYIANGAATAEIGQLSVTGLDVGDVGIGNSGGFQQYGSAYLNGNTSFSKTANVYTGSISNRALFTRGSLSSSSMNPINTTAQYSTIWGLVSPGISGNDQITILRMRRKITGGDDVETSISFGCTFVVAPMVIIQEGELGNAGSIQYRGTTTVKSVTTTGATLVSGKTEAPPLLILVIGQRSASW